MKTFKILLACSSLAVSSFSFAQCNDSHLDNWSVVNNTPVSENGYGASLSVTDSAAMGGTSCGLSVKTIITNSGSTGGDSDKPYIIDDSPNGETRFRAAFYINANGLQLPAAGTSFRKAKFHVAQCASGECEGGNVMVWRVVNRAAAGQPVDVGLEFWIRDNNLSGTNPRTKKRSFGFDIPDTGAQRIEYDLDIANGTLKVWLNATAETDPQITLPTEFNSLDLSPWSAGIKRARLGFIERRTSIPENQTFYLDEYESRRQTFIGM